MSETNSENKMNGKIPGIEFAKLGAVTVVAVIALWLMSEGNKSTVGAINSHDANMQSNVIVQVEAMKELTKAITEWRIEMAKNRQDRASLN